MVSQIGGRPLPLKAARISSSQCSGRQELFVFPTFIKSEHRVGRIRGKNIFWLLGATYVMCRNHWVTDLMTKTIYTHAPNRRGPCVLESS